MKTLKDYSEQITKPWCQPCMKAKLDEYNLRRTPLNINPNNIKQYDHDGGWAVEGFKEKQWLYIVCPKCNYQLALWKLGVPRG